MILLSKLEIKPTYTTTGTGLALENIGITWKLSEDNALPSVSTPPKKGIFGKKKGFSDSAQSKVAKAIRQNSEVKGVEGTSNYARMAQTLFSPETRQRTSGYCINS